MLKNNPTKTGSINKGRYMNSRDRAYALFFVDKKSIKQISKILSISTKSISTYLNTLKEYKTERQSRKKANILKRKEYKRNWDNTKRVRKWDTGEVTAATMLREHIEAVNVLSRERYF